MDCKKISQKMMDYNDVQLKDDEIIEFENHMKNCAKCRKEFDEITNTLKSLKLIEELEVPTHINQNIMKILERNKNRKKIYIKNISLLVCVGSIISIIYIVNIKDINQKTSPVTQSNIPKLKTPATFSLNENTLKEKVNINKDIKEDIKEDINIKEEVNKDDKISHYKKGIYAMNKNIMSIMFENKSNNRVSLYVTNKYENIISEKFTIQANNTFNEEIHLKLYDKNNLYNINMEIIEDKYNKSIKNNFLNGYIKVEFKR